MIRSMEYAIRLLFAVYVGSLFVILGGLALYIYDMENGLAFMKLGAIGVVASVLLIGFILFSIKGSYPRGFEE